MLILAASDQPPWRLVVGYGGPGERMAMQPDLRDFLIKRDLGELIDRLAGKAITTMKRFRVLGDPRELLR
jgi:hypothetical protein